MKRICLLICILMMFHKLLYAQVCGTPGLDGPKIIRDSTNYNNYYYSASNTYYPPIKNSVLQAGAKNIMLDSVPNLPLDEGVRRYGYYGTRPIRPGDLLLIIQMQDAIIDCTNSAFYGTNDDKSGPDKLGGTGFIDLGNSGKYEYVIATNTVSLKGGNLTFIGAGAGKGVVNEYTNVDRTATRGRRTFQVIRVPQYSNLKLQSNIGIPSFNGQTGGVLAFNTVGEINMNGFTIDVSARGFGGAQGLAWTDGDLESFYVLDTAEIPMKNPYGYLACKGNGIAGSADFSFTQDYYYSTFNGDGYPVSSLGIGAPGNAGGGGGIRNRSGGGGGGNGGSGGVGGNGIYNSVPTDVPNGGRPGSAVYSRTTPDLTRLIMGGGGGSGSDAVHPGNAGGIVLLNAKSITGNGLIKANSTAASYGGLGGCAGGTVCINVTDPDPSLALTIEAKGGNGGNAEKTYGYDGHGGCGGGGGGGQIFYSVPAGNVTTNVSKGLAGIPEGAIPVYLAADGEDGNAKHFDLSELPPHLRPRACYPQLSTQVSMVNPVNPVFAGNQVTYVIKTTNIPNVGNAAGVQVEVQLPTGFSYVSATVAYTGNSSGPATITNTSGNLNRPMFGDFNLFPGEEVIITLQASINCSTPAGTYHTRAQALYLDPLRTIDNPYRKITASENAFSGANTTYQTEPASSVPGSNYNGNLAAATTDDVVIKAITITNNQINPAPATVFCSKGNPGIIKGELPEGLPGVYSYQWQQSADNITFTDIPDAINQDFAPPQITSTVYYRRVVFYSGCVPLQGESNVVMLRVMQPFPVDFEMPDICLKDGLARFINKTQVTDMPGTQVSYLWDFGDPNTDPLRPNTSTEKDGRHTYLRSGNYTVKLSIYRDGACPQDTSKTFTVNGSMPKASFNLKNTSKICSGTTVEFEDKASVDFGEITKIEWYYDYGNHPTVVETDNDPEKRNRLARVYPHTYNLFRTPASKRFDVRMVAYSGITCVDDTVISIVVYAVPEATFDIIPDICSNAARFELTQGREIHGVVNGRGIYSGDGVTNTNGKFEFDPKVTGFGVHPISYTFVSDEGCSSETITRNITVYRSPVVNAGTDKIILEGGEVDLLAEVTGLTNESNLKYEWTPATGLNKTDVKNPMASPTDDIIYKVKVTSDQGCYDTDEVRVKVVQNPEIPNTFSPNGDGINDEWKIKYLEGHPAATIEIFNRFGDRVFISNTSKKVWDGKCNGTEVPAGVYYYSIDLHNGRKAISGSLTVLR